MKTLALLVCLTLSMNILANELQWVDEQIEAIKPPRSGILKAKINATKSPFIFLTKKKAKDKKKVLTSSVQSSNYKKAIKRKKVIQKHNKALSLDAIINHSALINGKWYKRHQKVGKYTLSVVNRSNVILTYKKKELLLSMISNNKKLKFKRN